MKFTKRRVIAIAFAIFIILCIIILTIVLLLQGKDEDSEDTPICIFKRCLTGKGHGRSVRSALPGLCFPKSCRSPDNSSGFEGACILHSCEIEGVGKGDEFCVSKICISGAQAKLGYTGEICLTKDCVLSASKILESLNQHVNPCDDFHEFTCGGFFEKSAAMSDQSALALESGEDEVAAKVKEILGEPIDSLNSDSLKKGKTVYRICQNSYDGDDKSVQEFTKLLISSKFQEWPSLDPSWDSCSLDLEHRMAMLNAYGVDSFVKFIPEIKGENNTLEGSIYIASPLIEGICDKDFEDEDGNLTDFAIDVTKEYRETMATVLLLLDVAENVTEQDVDAVLRFDAKFCKVIKSSKGDSSSHNLQKQTLQEIIIVAPQINWSRWHYIIFKEIGLSHRLDKSPIYGYGIEKSLDAITTLIYSTDARTVANYLSWKFAFHHLAYLSSPFKQIVEDHYSIFEGHLDFVIDPKPWTPKWAHCVQYIRKLMPVALIPSYLSKLVDKKLKDEMNQTITAVKVSLNETFNATSYLQDEEKLKFSDKLHALKFSFFPDKDRAFYNEYYLSLPTMNVSDSFLMIGMALKKFTMRKVFEAALLKGNITAANYAVIMHNPFEGESWTDFKVNSTLLSFADVETSTLDPGQLKYMNYGSFGSKIGHLLAYGFFHLGTNLPVNWTSEPSELTKNLEKKSGCFRYRYFENRTALNINGDILDKIMYDNQGIQSAFEAYIKYQKDNGKEQGFPGLSYSNEQLFFINYAKFWCTLSNSKGSAYKSSKLRVNTALKNTNIFSESYNCNRGSPMNPLNKCEPLWD